MLPNRNRRNKSALVMLSGGLDSTVALYWTLKVRRYFVLALTFNYFSRSKKEMEATKRISKLVGCKRIELDLQFLREIDDLKKQNANLHLEKAPSAYIPSRNVVFYGIATSLAEVHDCQYIVAGHNKDDVLSFPDSSLTFFRQFNKTTSIGLFSGGRTGRVILPLAKLSKAGAIRLGAKLGVPFEETWSCYFDRSVPCGKCPACKLRWKAFHEARIEDPLIRRY
jgi:7-cyano-7-deazaguanine synthase